MKDGHDGARDHPLAGLDRSLANAKLFFGKRVASGGNMAVDYIRTRLIEHAGAASTALNDRRALGNLRLNTELAMRFGIGLFGAQDDEPDRPRALPSARYRIATLDLSAVLPFKGPFIESWRLAFRGQLSGRNLYGSDSFSVGGPYSVRGYDSDRAEIGRSGWYTRQELTFAAGEGLHPYLLTDMGKVRGGGGLLASVGARVRAGWRGLNLDAFVAMPLARDGLSGNRLAQLGLSASWGF